MHKYFIHPVSMDDPIVKRPIVQIPYKRQSRLTAKMNYPPMSPRVYKPDRAKRTRYRQKTMWAYISDSSGPSQSQGQRDPSPSLSSP